MPPRVQPYREVLAEHRARLDRLIDRRGVAKLKKLYEQTQASLTAKLADAVRAGRKDSFTAQQLRVLLAQARQGEAVIMRRLAGELGDISLEAQTESLRGIARDVTRLERHFTGVAPVLPIEEAATFQGLIEGRRSSLLRMHEEDTERYGKRIVKRVENALTKSLMEGETQTQAIDRIQEATHGEWWQGERIVRTETAYAFSAAASDGIAEISDAVGGLWQRWTEFVDDATKAGLDDRTAVDSEAMHGQVAPPGGMFTQPPRSPAGKPVQDGLVGEEWPHPPNRCNDRSVLVPFRPEWGLPGWQWKGGRRVPMTKLPSVGERERSRGLSAMAPSLFGFAD